MISPMTPDSIIKELLQFATNRRGDLAALHKKISLAQAEADAHTHALWLLESEIDRLSRIVAEDKKKEGSS